MDALKIEGTSYTPEVIFDVDANIYKIEGDSRPEDTFTFYKELIDWLSLLKEKGNKDSINIHGAELEFKFDYLNSSSSKFVLKVIQAVADLKSEGFQFKVIWYYDEPDLDMKELGEEYAELAEVEIDMRAVDI